MRTLSSSLAETVQDGRSPVYCMREVLAGGLPETLTVPAAKGKVSLAEIRLNILRQILAKRKAKGLSCKRFQA